MRFVPTALLGCAGSGSAHQPVPWSAGVRPRWRNLGPMSCRAAGRTSLNAITGQLNARKVATANGGQWGHVRVREILT